MPGGRPRTNGAISAGSSVSASSNVMAPSADSTLPSSPVASILDEDDVAEAFEGFTRFGVPGKAPEGKAPPTLFTDYTTGRRNAEPVEQVDDDIRRLVVVNLDDDARHGEAERYRRRHTGNEGFMLRRRPERQQAEEVRADEGPQHELVAAVAHEVEKQPRAKLGGGE